MSQALGAVLLLLAACSSGSAAPSADMGATPDSSTAIGSEECRPIDLRSPQGVRVDLTGTWSSDAFDHHVRQIGDCVWWIGYSIWPGTQPGELATLAFFGHLDANLTLAGAWTSIVRPAQWNAYFSGEPEGSVAFGIEFDSESGLAAELTQVGAVEPAGTYPASALRLVGPLPPSANPPQQ
jgi:hypothetical protein